MKKTYESTARNTRNTRTSNPGKPVKKKSKNNPGPFDDIGRAAKSVGKSAVKVVKTVDTVTKDPKKLAKVAYELSGFKDVKKFAEKPTARNAAALGVSAASYLIPFGGKALQASKMAKFQRDATNSYNRLKASENAASGAQKTMYKNLRESAEQPMVRDKMGRLTYRDNVIN